MSNPTDFWNSVGATDADGEYVYGYLLERGTPVPLHDLAEHLVARRLQEQLHAQAEVEARRAVRYQPKETFQTGDRLYFPALNNASGVVKKTRAGDNPRYGDFQIATVLLEGEAKPHEFAASFAHAHPLNQERDAQSIAALTPAEAFAEHGEGVLANLRRRLRADKEFVFIGEQCFLKGMLTKIPDGYLHIAEAAIEAADDALPTSELVKILELPPDVKKGGVTFSVAYALAQDARFEDVGPEGRVRWYLAEKEPLEAREQPAILGMENDPVIALAPELETIASDLFHETDLDGGARATRAGAAEITVVLTYPHRRAGTLPLLPSVRALLPAFMNPRLKLNFVETASGDQFAGFAVAQGNYLAGLNAWFHARRLEPGAIIVLRKHSAPLTIELDYQPQRERSIWVRVARMQSQQLTFTQERRPLGFKCDEEMLIMVGDAPGIDAVAEKLRAAHPSLENLLEYVFPELAKLSGAGRVHAKTLYCAVNFLRRAGLRAVMSALSRSRAFTTAGGGYFTMSEAQREKA